MKEDSTPYINEMLKAIRGLKHNLERFIRASDDFAEIEKDHPGLYAAAVRVNNMLTPTTAMFDKIEIKLEKWLDDKNRNRPS